jgi:hypothetical protein
METIEAYAEPMRVGVVDGEVVVTGPGAVGVALTADAADETAARLRAAALCARENAVYASQTSANEA